MRKGPKEGVAPLLKSRDPKFGGEPVPSPGKWEKHIYCCFADHIFQSMLHWTFQNIIGGMTGKWIAFAPGVCASRGFHPNYAANQCAKAMKLALVKSYWDHVPRTTIVFLKYHSITIGVRMYRML